MVMALQAYTYKEPQIGKTKGWSHNNIQAIGPLQAIERIFLQNCKLL